MKRIIITALLMTAFLAQFGACRAAARQAKEQAGKERAAGGPAATPERPVAPLRRDFKDSFPIPPGEKLEYEVRISRFPIYASLGVLTFENLGAVAPPQDSGLTAPATEDQQKMPDPVSTAQWIEGLNMEFRPSPDEQLWRLRATAVSKGMFVSMLGFDANYRFETLVDMRDFSARANVKDMREGNKHIIQSTVYAPAEQQVNYLTFDANNPAARRAKLLPREDGTLSLLSAIYFVRLQKLKEGQTLTFPVSADETNYKFEILVGKRESLKTECGKVKTVRLEPKLFGPGRLFSKLKGEMSMWVSDDDKRTPLRLVARTSKGTITAKLLNFKNKCGVIEQGDEKREMDVNNGTGGKVER
ncbi:MAG TPA: DUF3108 domain-containing protein [Blastocatellia bacterium]|nr:DUF3108 domain-containing protein [Blastocatellia bacterium]